MLLAFIPYQARRLSRRSLLSQNEDRGKKKKKKKPMKRWEVLAVSVLQFSDKVVQFLSNSFQMARNLTADNKKQLLVTSY